MSVHPTDLLAQRHRSYRQAQERYQRAVTARQDAQQRVTELESELAAAEGRDRVALGDALVDGRRPPKPEADSVRSQLEEAKQKAEALVYAEQREAGKLGRLPVEHKDEWLRQASRDLRKARDVYVAAIDTVARARDQLGDEATLVSFLHNEGAYVQAITGALQRPGAHGTTDPIGFAQLTDLMLAEAASVEEKALLDPNRPQPEPQLHLAHTGTGRGSEGWGQ